MFLEVIKANYINGYKIHLVFNDQTSKTVDLGSSLNGSIFKPLKDLNIFKHFKIKYNTIEWENGADFAPEYLYSLPAVSE